jgi:hypothetical protein
VRQVIYVLLLQSAHFRVLDFNRQHHLREGTGEEQEGEQ